jgi:hypothetical protein
LRRRTLTLASPSSTPSGIDQFLGQTAALAALLPPLPVAPVACATCGRAARECGGACVGRLEAMQLGIADAVVARIAATNAPRVIDDVALTDDVREEFVAWLAGQGYSADDDRGWKGSGGQCGLSRCHLRAHLQGFFPRLSAMVAPSAIDGYITQALSKRAWSSVQKECFTVRLLLKFCVARGWIVNPPDVPDPPETATGVRDPNRKEHAIDLTPEQWEAILLALPELASRARRGVRRTPVRDPTIVQYDVMRRPVTIERLRRPEHWRPEFGPKLRLTPDIDKNGKRRQKRGEKEQWVILSARAFEIIKRHATGDGLIFGKYRRTAASYLRDAALAIGLPADIAEKVSSYDGRHNGIRHAVDETGDLRGVSAQCGTSVATLSKHYLDSDEKQASRMIEARAAKRAAKALVPSQTPLAPERGPSARPAKGAAGPALDHASLDEAEPPDYSPASHREGGGIGRRTSLRC